MYEYLEINGLNFTSNRKMSSQLVHNGHEYYLFCKGAIDVIHTKLFQSEKNELKRIDQLMTSKFPELRTLACAYKKINNFNFEMNIIELEMDLELLGIIGIRDTLQSNVLETVRNLKSQNLKFGLCTGDRLIIAIQTAIEAGILAEFQIVTPLNFKKCKQKSIVFDGNFIEYLYHNPENQNEFIQCDNFVGYSLMPQHKQQIVEIFEKNKIPILSIGDGFNDVQMFQSSSLSVAIKGNQFITGQADYSIKQFNDLNTLFDYSWELCVKNQNLINFTFYRCSVVVFVIVSDYLYNYHSEKYTSIFNGFVIQAFNFGWLIFGLGYSTFARCKIIKKSKISIRNTFFWNLFGIIDGIYLFMVTYAYFGSHHLFSDVMALILISYLNIKLLSTTQANINMLNVLCLLMGIINFWVYLFNFSEVNNIIELIFRGQSIIFLSNLVIYFCITFAIHYLFN